VEKRCGSPTISGKCWSSVGHPSQRNAPRSTPYFNASNKVRQPLPPDSDDYVQSGSNDQSCFILNHDPSVEPSMFLHLVLDLTHQMAFVAAKIDPQDDDRTSVLSQNEPRSVHAGQGSHQPSPRGQQRSAELPVSAMPAMADTLVLHGNPRHVPGAAGFHQCQTTQTSASPGTSRPSIRFFCDANYQLSITLHLEETTSCITDCCIHVAGSSGSASPVFLQDLDRSTLPPGFEKEGRDWFAIFNPKAKRMLDVSLVHTLFNGRLVVSSVRSPLQQESPG